MARDQGWLCKRAAAGAAAHDNRLARKLVSIPVEVSARGPCRGCIIFPLLRRRLPAYNLLIAFHRL